MQRIQGMAKFGLRPKYQELAFVTRLLRVRMGPPPAPQYLTSSKTCRGCCKHDFGLQKGFCAFRTKTVTLVMRHHFPHKADFKCM